MRGTSMATPLVSGLCALLWSYKPTASYQQIKDAVMKSVDVNAGLQGKLVSNGRVNALKALQALGGVPQPTPPPGPEPTPGPSATPPPGPSPVPTVTPTPTPTQTPPPVIPGNETASTPLLNGQTYVRINNPNVQLQFSYDVSNFLGAQGVWIEIGSPNRPFSNPNDLRPDTQHAWIGSVGGLRGSLPLSPNGLPGWGSYQFRVIPVTQQGQPVGRFSNPSTLLVWP